MSWTERRAKLLEIANSIGGWGCATLPGDRHIGRVVMSSAHSAHPGFYRQGSAACAYLDAQFAASQKRRTMVLPK